MLEPEYLLRVTEGAEAIAEELHGEIISRIVERIIRRLDRKENYILTAQDKWQLESLTESGYLLEDIQALIASRTKLQQREVKEAMEEAGVRALSFDDAIYQAAGISTKALTQSPHLVRLMERAYKATLGEWENFTRTTATASQQAFISACDKAYNLVTTGAMSYTQAVREAVNDIVEEGVVIHYPSGHTDTIETATLRAVRTGVSQATAEVSLARMDELNWDIVLVSSHMGARPEHHLWQGKFYSRSGKDKRFPDFVSSTGYGTVTGLCGANCRHSFGPGDGVNNPYEQYDSEENRKAYEIQQRQRLLERRIRKTKREVMGLKTAWDTEKDPTIRKEFDLDYQKKSALLTKQNTAYKQYCRDHDLKELPDRLAIAKWDRQQAAEARGAARKYENMLAKQAEFAKIKDEIRSAGNLTKSALISLPPKSIDLDSLSFDDVHINTERGHNVTREMAESWIKNSKVSVSVWNGRFERYFAEDGAAYIDVINNTIRTAFAGNEFDDNARGIMEVLKKYGY